MSLAAADRRHSLPAAAHDAATARTLRLADGRTLAWQVYGDPAGRPLHFFHGFPSSRLLGSLVHEEAAHAGIALVAADRPGFGMSTPKPNRSIADWADDVAALADHLGHERFGVLGVSCGGPYALACARAMPERLTYVGLMAGMGPMDRADLRRQQLAPLKGLFGLARVHSVLASPMLLADAWLFRANPEKAVAALSALLTEPDRRLLAAQPIVRARFCASFVAAYAQGIAGARLEATLIARLRDAMLRDIRPTVHVYQGGVDRHVPADMGVHMANALPDGRLHLYPDEGHLSILVNRFANVAAHCLAPSLDRAVCAD